MWVPSTKSKKIVESSFTMTITQKINKPRNHYASISLEQKEIRCKQIQLQQQGRKLNAEHQKRKSERRRQLRKEKRMVRDAIAEQEADRRLDNAPLESFKIETSIDDKLTKLITKWCQKEFMDYTRRPYTSLFPV